MGAPICRFRLQPGVGVEIEEFSGGSEQHLPIGSTEVARQFKKELDRGQDCIGVDGDSFCRFLIGTGHEGLPFEQCEQ